LKKIVIISGRGKYLHISVLSSTFDAICRQQELDEPEELGELEDLQALEEAQELGEKQLE
jgi:hypothetical protein